MHYKRLGPSDWAWLKKFDKIFTGRASQAECDELRVCEQTRRELYNARYARRQDAGFRSAARRDRLAEDRTGSDPTEAVIELLDLKKQAKLPLSKTEEGKPLSQSPAKRPRRGQLNFSKKVA